MPEGRAAADVMVLADLTAAQTGEIRLGLIDVSAV
jgi:hypothetical protein